MSALTQIESAQEEPPASQWSLFRRVAFRFCFVYLGLFCLSTQIVTSLFSPSQGEGIPDPATIWPLRQFVLWTARHVFHSTASLAVGDNSASGDDLFGWVLVFCLLIFAVLSTAIWSLVDVERGNYTNLHKWFWLFVRFCLAGQMLNYGICKVIPLQMPFPSLLRLLQPFGSFSPMGVLWSSIGASPPYEIFAGCAEVLGGLLLIVPRTTAFGALICLADMIQVFMLNMTYDVPVKLFAFHLILLGLFLLAPYFRPIVNLFFLNRDAIPFTQTLLFGTRRANRAALAAQILFGLWLVGMNVYFCRELWYVYGGGRPISPLYGIWEVSQASIDEQLRPPLLTDSERWRRVVFDSPTWMAFQRMDDSFGFYGASINLQDKILVLTKSSDKNWKANFTFKRAAQNTLVLDGEMDSHRIQMHLQLVDRNKYLLVSRGFRWIQEEPFNR